MIKLQDQHFSSVKEKMFFETTLVLHLQFEEKAESADQKSSENPEDIALKSPSFLPMNAVQFWPNLNGH